MRVDQLLQEDDDGSFLRLVHQAMSKLSVRTDDVEIDVEGKRIRVYVTPGTIKITRTAPGQFWVEAYAWVPEQNWEVSSEPANETNLADVMATMIRAMSKAQELARIIGGENGICWPGDSDTEINFPDKGSIKMDDGNAIVRLANGGSWEFDLMGDLPQQMLQVLDRLKAMKRGRRELGEANLIPPDHGDRPESDQWFLAYNKNAYKEYRSKEAVLGPFGFDFAVRKVVMFSTGITRAYVYRDQGDYQEIGTYPTIKAAAFAAERVSAMDRGREELGEAKATETETERAAQRAANDPQAAQLSMTTKQRLLAGFRQHDPSPNGKYVGWMVRKYAANTMDLADLANVKWALDIIEKNFQRLPPDLKDVDRHRSAASLVDAVDAFQNKTPVSKRQADKQEVDDLFTSGKAKVILDTPTVRLVELLHADAAKILGMGTKWCIAARDDWSRESAFRTYTKSSQGQLFIVYDKKNGRKYGANTSGGTFVDEKDDTIGERKLFRDIPDLWQLPDDFIKWFPGLGIQRPSTWVFSIERDPRFIYFDKSATVEQWKFALGDGWRAGRIGDFMKSRKFSYPPEAIEAMEILAIEDKGIENLSPATKAKLRDNKTYPLNHILRAKLMGDPEEIASVVKDEMDKFITASKSVVGGPEFDKLYEKLHQFTRDEFAKPPYKEMIHQARRDSLEASPGVRWDADPRCHWGDDQWAQAIVNHVETYYAKKPEDRAGHPSPWKRVPPEVMHAIMDQPKIQEALRAVHKMQEEAKKGSTT